MRKKTVQKRKVKYVRIAIIAICCILPLVLIVGAISAWKLLGLVNFVDSNDSNEYVESIAADPLDPDYSGVIIDDPVKINDEVGSVVDIAVQGNTDVITNILLLGVETENRDTYNNGRSDTMMIMSINTCKKTIKLISLMRDTYLDIPDHAHNKLNVAFSLHGFDLLSSTIEKNFRLDIDQYVAVNFDAFTTIVDVMKGIDVKLTAAEAKNLGVGTTDGAYHLDGKTALVYSRIRSITGINGNRDDFGRNERQRTVMKALLTDAKSMNLITLKNVLETMLPEISTNMNKNEFLSYILHSAAYLKYEVSDYHLPMQGEYDDPYVTGIGRVLTLTDAKKTVLELQHAIYG